MKKTLFCGILPSVKECCYTQGKEDDWKLFLWSWNRNLHIYLFKLRYYVTCKLQALNLERERKREKYLWENWNHKSSEGSESRRVTLAVMQRLRTSRSWQTGLSILLWIQELLTDAFFYIDVRNPANFKSRIDFWKDVCGAELQSNQKKIQMSYMWTS